MSDARFSFGRNWRAFSTHLAPPRVAEAEASLRSKLEVETLEGLRFLDIGSGSGLFSLAAARLGATVRSFDYDVDSVACTEALRSQHAAEHPSWEVSRGDVLDGPFMDGLGTFDVVYAWGVLHHTGAMWLALEHAMRRVKPDGKLFIAIYNDQGLRSHVWWMIKYVYNKLPSPLATPYAACLGFTAYGLNAARHLLQGNVRQAVASLDLERRGRGMRLWHDLVDWIGGFPYEFARFEVLQAYTEARGFEFIQGKAESSLGCHELVLRRRC
ncbi:MAG: class I SAM-dependent methyltransferase [Candidatus Sericytochromatia bacterium]|nr:class I SAM-dependent methyltransferase [Candidatus Sericytochromatia bacterium]